MPAKNRIKQYVENGHYHVYNRGVEKRRIFLDDQDYRVFLHLLKFYLEPNANPEKHPLTDLTGFVPNRVRPISTLSGEIDLFCYCLMPNHFHLMVRQKGKEGMKKLLLRLSTTYSMYFNRRYNRVGHLFQGPYRATLVDNDNYLLHLSRYIHQNPSLTKGFLAEYPYSSYPIYIGERKASWINTQPILSLFEPAKLGNLNLNKYSNYKDFVETYDVEPEEILGHLLIEKD
ncbi:MAG: transposase [Candidatus Woykebacteria bacterium]